MGTRRKALLRASITAAAVLVSTACTADDGDREGPRVVVTASATSEAQPGERLRNRMVGLTDLQGAPLYVVPEAQTRSHLDALARPPLFERVYSPAECAPEAAFTAPPGGLDGVLGRSNLNEDQSRLRVEIYTAEDAEELASYFVGTESESPMQCTEFSVAVGDTTQAFSYRRVDAPPLGDRASSAHYSVTENDSTTHYLRVTAVNGLLAASLILSTTEPADQTMTDTVLRLTQQAIT
ncbi:hypothetical protein PTW37_08795 [Arthrobacter agilis]|uniref:hypothetical protein n=1 Tax=Arthrobacter agilis TaxID=37921 RepID=UPI0023650219|nr:hypothetical protein [Arthrobacter agilis]WDF31988.1 hypothetical protein PTW37_08795 [Arthrobacter agilis]